MERVVNGEFIYGNLPVYPSFENVNALLDKAGMKKDYHVDAAEVLCLTVVNSNSKARDMYMGDGYQNHSLSGDFDVELTTEEPEEIRQILEGVYPDVFMEYWKPAGMINTDYYVTVTFRNSPENDRFLGYYMVEDKIPEFVKEKTKYTEEKRG